MNNNPKNDIVISGNIRQKRLTILEYFDTYIYHHKYMHQNIPELLVFFVWYFPTSRCYFSDYRSNYMFWNCQEEMVFGFMSRLIISWLYQAQVNVFILRSSKKFLWHFPTVCQYSIKILFYYRASETFIINI